MSERYDVIIVGGGPAGGSAAYFLGQAGKRVLLLEKERLPRYKTCGGGLSIDFLKDQFPFSFESIVSSEVRSFSYVFDGYQVTIPVNPGVVGMVMRDQLDACLLDHAQANVLQEAGVQSVVETTDKVAVETQAGKTYEASYLIGADGANSVVAHSLGLRRERNMAAAIEAEVPVSPVIYQRFSSGPVFIFDEIPFGYLWIFPKQHHLSVGIAAWHPRRGELQAVLRRVMARYGVPLKAGSLHGHPIPIYTGREKIATPRTLLAGDAAGLVDPLSGEGIRYAIKSGRLAAEAILAGHPERYSSLVFREIGINHLFALGAAQLFYRFQLLCLALGAPNPFVTQTILDLLSDRTVTFNILLRGIFTLPIFVLTEGIAWLAGKLNGPQKRERIRSWVYSYTDQRRSLKRSLSYDNQ